MSGCHYAYDSHETSYDRKNPYALIIVPETAVYMVVGTWSGNKDHFVLTQSIGAVDYPSDYDVVNALVPERNIIRDASSCLYDYDFFRKWRVFHIQNWGGRE